jgi:chorismate mutase
MFDKDYLIIHKSILPEFYEYVITARDLVENEGYSTCAACKEVDISRSTYYKYKDYIYSPGSGDAGRKAVISMLLSHEVGVLSTALNRISTLGASVLTISQSMPIRDIASVVMTLDVAQMDAPIEQVTEPLSAIAGVENVYLLAIE